MNDLPQLRDAYALNDADEVRRLYAEWANSYDAGFVEAMGYQLPQEVARSFVGAGGLGPVLDIGAGTGLVAQHLAAFGVSPIDAVDLSPQMLDIARTKGLYRDLMAVDFMGADNGLVAGHYTGIVSAGTFTHGHLGPEGLPPLVDLLADDGLAVISVNLGHFQAEGFDEVCAGLATHVDLQTKDIRIYDDRASSANRDDRARLVLIRKTKP